MYGLKISASDVMGVITRLLHVGCTLNPPRRLAAIASIFSILPKHASFMTRMESLELPVDLPVVLMFVLLVSHLAGLLAWPEISD